MAVRRFAVMTPRTARRLACVYRLAGLLIWVMALGLAFLPIPDLWLCYRGWRLVRDGRPS